MRSDFTLPLDEFDIDDSANRLLLPEQVRTVAENCANAQRMFEIQCGGDDWPPWVLDIQEKHAHCWHVRVLPLESDYWSRSWFEGTMRMPVWC